MAAVRYAVRDGWRLVIRHWGMSILTIFTAMSVFFIIGFSALFVLNIKNIVQVMEDQLSIQAYMKNDADLNKIAKQIRSIPNVTKVSAL